MMQRILYIVLFFLLLDIADGRLIAQKIYSTNNRKAIKLYEESEHLMARRQYIEVINILNLALERDIKFVEAHLRIAFCYKLLNNINGQKRHLEDVIKYASAPERYLNVYFSLGEAYYLTQEYDKALEVLNEFLKSQGVNQRLIPEADWLVRNVYFAKDAIMNPLEIEPVMLPEVINSGPLQYFPVLTGDEAQIYFTKRQGAHPRYDENIYMSKKDSQGNWIPPYSLSANLPNFPIW